MTKRTKTCSAALIATLALSAACAGKGVSFEEAEPAITASCINCHDSSGIDGLLTDVTALDDAAFTAEAFPDDMFPSGLVVKSVADLIATANPAADAALDPDMALRKAWVLHELHELQAVLIEATPPDFTTQDNFDDFATFGEPGAYEGCEIGDKLDLGYADDPEGMPPRWAPPIFELLQLDFVPLDDVNRQIIKDYTDGLLPGGLRSCVPGEGSAS